VSDRTKQKPTPTGQEVTDDEEDIRSFTDAVSGGAPVGTPRRPWVRRGKPAEEPEDNGATVNW